MMKWMGQAIRDYISAFGWVAALITLIVLAAILIGAALLLDIDVAALVQGLTS